MSLSQGWLERRLEAIKKAKTIRFIPKEKRTPSPNSKSVLGINITLVYLIISQRNEDRKCLYQIARGKEIPCVNILLA